MAQGAGSVEFSRTGRPCTIKTVLCLVILFFCLALVAAMVVIVYFLIGTDGTSAARRERLAGTVTLNRPWNEALADSSSVAYRSLENNICEGLDDAIEQVTDECAVTSFEEGSIKGHFVTMVRVRDLEELDLVIARYREGIMVGGQPASVEVVVDPGDDDDDDGDDNEEDEEMPFQGVVGADGDYRASWTSDADTITVTIVGRTRGWVGFGISGTGGMKEADIMMAWVDGSGTGHILDTYAEENGAPVVDTMSQDWKLLEASEDAEFTRVTVRRFLRLCDPRDLNITSGTVKVIWALAGMDPTASEAFLSPYSDYHGDRRGTASRRLLDPSGLPPRMPKDTISLDFMQENVAVPHEVDTTYWCRFVPLPNMTHKHHFIMAEPVIQEGNELHVHHLVIYACYDVGSAPERFRAEGGFNCLLAEETEHLNYCPYLIVAWAVGGADFYMPEHVGFPLLGPDSPTYVLIENHYDNPHLRQGIVDSSGVRLWLTPSLRPYDASMLEVGLAVSPMHMIPPKVENFMSTGHCSQACLNQGLAGLDDGIHIFAGFLHTHLAGVSLVLRHIRNGTELPPIMEDKSYDFNYQNTFMLDQEVTVLPGDRLILDCGYTTTDREEVTFGGSSTHEEMCLVFLYHYPDISLKYCISSPSVPRLASLVEGSQIMYNESDTNFYFTAPENVAGFPVEPVLATLLTSEDGAAEALQQVTRDGGTYSMCMTTDDFQFLTEDIPPVERPYTEPFAGVCHLGTEDLP